MTVEVHLLHQSQPIICSNVVNAYVKGGFYCVMYETDAGERLVDKFPAIQIFRVRETYA